MNESTIITIIGWAVGVLSVSVGSLLAYMFRQSDRISRVENRMDSRIATIDTDIKWIIRSLGVAAGQTLHSPHTPELDVLIEKYEREELLWHEVGKFARMLKEISNGSETSKGDKLAATILLMSLEKTYGDILKSELVYDASPK